MAVLVNPAHEIQRPFNQERHAQPNVAVNQSLAAIDRWKKLSKIVPREIAIKVILIAAIAILSIAMFPISASITFTASPIIVIWGCLAGVFGIFASTILGIMGDFRTYHKPETALKVSTDISKRGLDYFEELPTHSDVKVRSLVRYGFIESEIGNRLKKMLDDRRILSKFVEKSKSIFEGVDLNKIPAGSGLHNLLPQYRIKVAELARLDLEYIDLRDRLIVPNLPFPNIDTN